MERDRREKGQAQAAGAVLAAVDSERGHRLEPGKGKAGGNVDKHAVWAVVVKGGDAGEVPVEAQVSRLWT